MMVKLIQGKNSMIPIAHYEIRYLISSKGEVFNLANNKYKKLSKQSNGYLTVALADGTGKHKTYSVHVLVAKHFIPNPYNHPLVNHKDGDKTNPDYENLEWCDYEYNAQHALKTGLRPGYMSADAKELYLKDVLAGTQVKDIAYLIDRRPETLHKMLRQTAARLGLSEEWQLQMKENRKNAAIRNLEKINN